MSTTIVGMKRKQVLKIAQDLHINGNPVWHSGNLLKSEFATAGHSHPLATVSVAGLMSAPSLVKLNSIQDSAINQSTADARYLRLAGGTMTGKLVVSSLGMQIGEGLDFTSNNNYFGTNLDARIITMLDSNGSGGNVDGGLIIQSQTTIDSISVELLRIRNNEFKWKGNDIWNAGNFTPSSKSDTTHTHPVATTSTIGFMSTADRTKMTSIQDNAINKATTDGLYSLNTHGHSTISGSNALFQTGVSGWAKNNGETSILGEISATNQVGDSRLNIHSLTGKVNVYLDGEMYVNEGQYKLWDSNTLQKSEFTPISHAGASGTSAHPIATVSNAGFMSPDDRTKVDNIQIGATNQTSNDNRYLQLSGGILTGGLVLDSDTTPQLHIKGGLNIHAEVFLSEDTAGQGARVRYDGNLNEIQLIGVDSGVETVGLSMSRAVGVSDLKYKGNTVWHLGNFNPSTKSDIGHTHTFASLTSKPTTLLGYGITDASLSTHLHDDRYYTETEIDTQMSGKSGTGHTHAFASLTTKPTTLLGYGITDASLSTHTHTFGSLTSKPTTLLGYGITDASLSTHLHDDRYYTETEVDTLLLSKSSTSHTHTFGSLTSKPTTLLGYGITDASLSTHLHDDRYYTETEINTQMGGKSDTSHNHNTIYLGIGAKASDSDKLDGLDSVQFLRSDASQVLDGGANTTLTIKSDDNGMSSIELYGDAQGTGRLYVGQSTTHGGGIEYNGDNAPLTTDAGLDFVTLYRRTSGINHWTAKNLHSDNNWIFRGEIYANTTNAVWHAGNLLDPATQTWVGQNNYNKGQVDTLISNAGDVRTMDANTLSNMNTFNNTGLAVKIQPSAIVADATKLLQVNKADSTEVFSVSYSGGVVIKGDLFVEGTQTYQGTTVVEGDYTVQGSLVAQGNVTLGDASTDVINVVGELISQGPIKEIGKYEVVHRRPLFGIAGDLQFQTDSTIFEEVTNGIYAINGSSMPNVKVGAVRYYRIYVVYSDDITTTHYDAGQRITLRIAGALSKDLELEYTWGDANARGDSYTEYFTDLPAGNVAIQAKLTQAGNNLGIRWIELVAYDKY